jgi:hypothetical protein
MNTNRLRDGAAVSLDPDAGCNEMQAAIFLGVSMRTLQACRVRGGGPLFSRLGRSVRYTRRALVEFMAERTVSSTTEAGVREVE